MNDRKQDSKCRHCGMPIEHYSGRLWHDGALIFPQYCIGGVTLHAPAAEPREWIDKAKEPTE